MAATHIEVIKANEGANVYGIVDGDLLEVLKETPNFLFVKARDGGSRKEIKVSKQTKRACRWSNQRTSPTFNI